MTVVFWISVAVVAYVYLAYPALLHAWARLRPAPFVSSHEATPGVSIVIAARNEGPRLAARIDNLLHLDYPADRRQIIIVCDGCSDGTHDVLEGYADTVEVVTLPPSGKALSLNAGVAHARFDTVVFADARQAFAPDALRELVAPFADPTVGGVTGELLLDCESALFANRRTHADRRHGAPSPIQSAAADRRHDEDRRTILSTIADGVGVYWRYEKQLRRLESTVGSTVGATGAIYALRRALWRPLPADTLLDDVLAPMRAVMAGSRVVFSEHAHAFDRATVDADAESRRKVRTLAGNYQILWLEPALLLPWHNPVWLQYVSHKLGRLAVPYAMLTIFVASIVLSDRAFYSAALWGQVAFYLLAGYGAVLELTSRVRESTRHARVVSSHTTAQEAS
ncbi:MAG TPA: glycosyltransferase family 2 protein [Vicinamibacterales bacterium]|jgi:cellulose synthase/poly-beta-1,6-N-acetylglucosamine synthase-like glycosyltransferase|nr:glycosyltransferase family 2 protein [Vicinamibacterales bacterium]